MVYPPQNFVFQKGSKLKVKKKRSTIKLTRIDHTAIWSRLAAKKRRFIPLDPDPDSPSDSAPEFRELRRGKSGKIKLQLTPDDWGRFWADRIRKHYKVDAPSVTDNEIYSSLVRARYVWQRQRDEDLRTLVDPDLPPCYYWDKYQVAYWVKSKGFPENVQDMFYFSGVCGRHLILIEPHNLSKNMGISDPELILSLSQAVRDLLGLPRPNGIRAIARMVPLEKFLHEKIRTGPNVERHTFKQFCEREGIDYEGARIQKNEGYKTMPCGVKVTVEPEESDVKWMPVELKSKEKKERDRQRLPYYPYRPTAEYDIHRSRSPSSSSSSDGNELQGMIPTVEELTLNAIQRDEYIPELLTGIVNDVIKEIRVKQARGKCRQELADRIMKQKLEDAYAYLKIKDPEEKLKIVTMLAEDLVQDVMKAKDILSDIDQFHKGLRKSKSSRKNEILETQEAVSRYVQDIMPIVVNAALEEMRNSEDDLRKIMERRDEEYFEEICFLRGPRDFEDSDSDTSITDK